MKHPLVRILLLATVLGVSSRAMADQGGPMAGVHELPVFVQERIELTPGTAGGRTPLTDPYPAGLGRWDPGTVEVGGFADLL